LIAVDILDMDPIPGATFIQGDFTERETQQRITKVLYGDEVDVVLSDMCPNTSGVKELDHERIIGKCGMFFGNSCCFNDSCRIGLFCLSFCHSTLVQWRHIFM
jgi:23S rRNA U2552 (ribose-2'-O)-methylase RlmE/FtsJ